MPSRVWAVPATRSRETHILRFLKNAGWSLRVVEVRLFKQGRLFDRVPTDTRRWEPSSDLAETAKEISSTSPIAGTRKLRLWHQTKFEERGELDKAVFIRLSRVFSNQKACSSVVPDKIRCGC